MSNSSSGTITRVYEPYAEYTIFLTLVREPYKGIRTICRIHYMPNSSLGTITRVYEPYAEYTICLTLVWEPLQGYTNHMPNTLYV